MGAEGCRCVLVEVFEVRGAVERLQIQRKAPAAQQRDVHRQRLADEMRILQSLGVRHRLHGVSVRGVGVPE
jgi:hypothetical protein